MSRHAGGEPVGRVLSTSSAVVIAWVTRPSSRVQASSAMAGSPIVLGLAELVGHGHRLDRPAGVPPAVEPDLEVGDVRVAELLQGVRGEGRARAPGAVEYGALPRI